MLTTVPAVLATVPAVLPAVAAIAAVVRVGLLRLRSRCGRGRSGRLRRGRLRGRIGRRAGAGVPSGSLCADGSGDIHAAGATLWIVPAADFLRRNRSTSSFIGSNATIDKIGASLVEEDVEKAGTPIQVHHHANAIIILGAVQVHADAGCQVDCGRVARTLSSSRSCSLGITFERDRGTRIEGEVGVLAHKVPQAIDHMRVIDLKGEAAVGTSAPGR